MIVRILYMALWAIIGLPTLCVACYQNRQTLWGWAFYFDNKEDGFDGSKSEFYDRYKGVDIDSMHWLKRAWYSYLWSAWRNPCWNLRFHPLVGVNVTHPSNLEFKGNTYHHEAKYSLEPNKIETKWYKLKAKFNGKTYRSWFYLIPINKSMPLIGGKNLYLRFGLKVYPCLYLDDWWLDKIKKEGWPKYKTHGLRAVTVRLRKAAN